MNLAVLTLLSVLSPALPAAATAAAAAAAPACSTAAPVSCAPLASGPGAPAPTEHRLDPGYEERNAAARKRWIAAMHRAEPRTDWKAIERANGERRMAERALLRVRKDYTADTWTERGSRNQAGRMHCVALSLDGATLYGGSDRGGVWRAAPDGSGWTAIGDGLWGGAHQVAVAATPTGQAVLALTNWGRLRYTLDDGANWRVPTGLPAGLDGGKRLLTDPTDRSRVFCLLHGSGAWELFRSLDGGVSWTSVRLLASAGDAWIDRIAGGTLYLIDGPELWISTNLGDTWRNESRLGAGAVDDAALAGSESRGPTLHVALHRPGGAWERYRSDNAGRTWVRLPDPTEFWGQLDASMSDEGVVVQGGVNVFRSDDGGQSSAPINQWWEYYANPLRKLHADLFGLDVLMVGGQETWFVSTDGGIFTSQDNLATVTNICLSGLGVSQYYSTHTSRLDPARIIAGAQDQGYQRSSVMGAPTADFEQIISGDYGHLTSSDGRHDWVYSTYPGFILVHEGEMAPALAQLDFPPGSRPQWLPAVVADPTNPTAFYFCADRLWRYERDAGDGTWRSFQESSQDFTAGGSGTLTMISISALDPQQRLGVTDSGILWYSTDAGMTWTASPDRGPEAHYFYGTALEHSPDNASTAIVAGSGYSGPAAYRTTDGGLSWQPLATGLPRTLVYDIAWAGPGSSVVFAATEAGPYQLDPAADRWLPIGGTVAPLTTYWSVETIPSIGVARFGTYGRGIWDWQFATVAEAGNCGDGVDNEGDGLADCDDTDCVGDAACRENCTNGADDDRDGEADCADADCALTDSDGDGRRDCDGSDCAPAVAGAWAIPGEIAELRVAKITPGTEDARLTWTNAQVAASGSATVSDVTAGSLAVLRSSGWPAGTLCLRNDAPAFTHDDPTAGLGAIWYLVRAQNACGAGPWGSGDDGVAIPAPGCP